jgi:hypothetical protein
MPSTEIIDELRSRLDNIGVGVIDSRQLAYRALTVLRVKPVTIEVVDDTEVACRELIAGNDDFCLAEDERKYANELEYFTY